MGPFEANRGNFELLSKVLNDLVLRYSQELALEIITVKDIIMRAKQEVSYKIWINKERVQWVITDIDTLIFTKSEFLAN